MANRALDCLREMWEIMQPVSPTHYYSLREADVSDCTAVRRRDELWRKAVKLYNISLRTASSHIELGVGT